VQKSIATAEHKDRKFVIECGGEGVGFYLYIFSGERCTHDYLQNTFELTKKFAFEEFGVPLESWQPSK
jgi:hypothetical protein